MAFTLILGILEKHYLFPYLRYSIEALLFIVYILLAILVSQV